MVVEGIKYPFILLLITSFLYYQKNLISTKHPWEIGLKCTQVVQTKFDVVIREEKLISVPVNFPSALDASIWSNMSNHWLVTRYHGSGLNQLN